MEESLKARLIGAAVLVALAVLLIPELLSGRKALDAPAAGEPGARGTRTFTIELGQGTTQAARAPSPAPAPVVGSNPEAVRSEDVAEASPRTAPEAVPEAAPEAVKSAAVEPPEPRPQPPPVVAAPAARSPAASQSGPPAAPAAEPPARTAATGGWAVQVGAFGSLDTARGLVKDLSGDGYRAFLSPVVRSGKTLHRVRVGPESDQAGAERLAQRLKARGLPATVVRND